MRRIRHRRYRAVQEPERLWKPRRPGRFVVSRTRLDRDVHRVLTQPMRDEHRRESFHVAASLPASAAGSHVAAPSSLVPTPRETRSGSARALLTSSMIRASAT